MFQDEALRGEIAERAVRPLSVVVLAQVFDDDARFGEGPEHKVTEYAFSNHSES